MAMEARHLLHPLFPLLLITACGGGDEAPIEAQPQPQQETPNTLNLSGVSADKGVLQRKLNGQPVLSRAVLNSKFANPTGSIDFPFSTTVEGNLTLGINASDPDGINAIALNLPELDANVSLCSGGCSNPFRQTITGFNPALSGAEGGGLVIQLVVTDNEDNQTTVDSLSINWQPKSIAGISTTREGDTISVSWEALDGVLRYNVYAATEFGLTPQNALTLENGVQFLSLTGTSQSFADASPGANYQIQVTGIDGGGESAFAEIIDLGSNLIPVNTPPRAQSDNFSTTEATLLSGNVIDNDVEADGQPLTVSTTPVVDVENGTLTLNADGSFDYQPRANFAGSDRFVYQVADSDNASAQAAVIINISASNDAPVAADNSYVIPPFGAIALDAPGLLDNDADINGDTLTVNPEPLVAPTQGLLTLAEDGSFNYLPNDGFSGTDTFTYEVLDGNGGSASAVVTFLDVGTNSPPQAGTDSYSVQENGTLSITSTAAGLLANDVDADGDPLVFTPVLITDPANGVLALDPDGLGAGTFRYTPDTNFYGRDQFTYEIVDDQGAPTRTQVVLVITQGEEDPIAVSDTYAMQLNSGISVDADEGLLLNDLDPVGGALTVNTTPVSDVSNGTLTLNADGSFTYVPNTGFSGTDRFSYQLLSSRGTFANADVSLSVVGESGTPRLSNDSYSFNEDEPQRFDVLRNDSHSLPLVITDASATRGSVSIVDNQLSYAPQSDDFGSVLINYTAQDELGRSASASATLEIVPVNDAPSATADVYYVKEDASTALIPVLFNDWDMDGDSLTLSEIVAASSGTTSIVGGQIAYTPAPEVSGSYEIRYRVSDTSGAFSWSTLTVEIESVNDPPGATDDTYSLDEDTNLKQNLLDNDTDPDSTSLTATLITSTSNGSLTLGADGEFSYTPDLNYNGSDSFRYRVSDGVGGTDEADVSLTINPVNDLPEISDQSYAIAESATDGAVVGTVLASDPEDSGLTFSLSGGDTGLFTIDSATGELRAKGASPFNYELATTHTVMVTATDGEGAGQTATVTANITDVLEPDIPAESSDFGRPVTGLFELTNAGVNATLLDSQLDSSSRLLLLGQLNNQDQDLFVARYTATDTLDSSFGYQGIIMLDMGANESAVSINQLGTDLYISYNQQNTSNEFCLLRLNSEGDLDTAWSSSGICTNTGDGIDMWGQETLILGTDFYSTGWANSGSDDSTLLVKMTSAGVFSDGSPIVDNLSFGRNDRGLGITVADGNILIAGDETSADGDTDMLAMLYTTALAKASGFNSGSPLIVDFDTNNDSAVSVVTDGGTSTYAAYMVGSAITPSALTKAAAVAFDQSGTLDTSFDGDGRAYIDLDNDGDLDTGTATANAIDYKSPDLFLAGSKTDALTQEAYLAKLNTDGTLDTGFASVGYVANDFNDQGQGNHLTLGSGSDLWLAGNQLNGTRKNHSVAKYSDSGVLDTSFATSGIAVLQNQFNEDVPSKLIQLNAGAHAGKYLLTANTHDGQRNQAILMRFSSDGSLDTSFATEGIRRLSLGTNQEIAGVVEQADGKWLVYGSVANIRSTGFVILLDTDGNRDASYGSYLSYSSEVLDVAHTYFHHGALDGNGKLVVAGSLVDSSNDLRSFILRLNPDGSLDTNADGYDGAALSFAGADGYVIGNINQDFAQLLINPDNSIFAAGTGVVGSQDMLITRFDASGVTDPSFNGGNVLTLDIDSDNNDDLVSLLQTSGGDLLLIGNTQATEQLAAVAKIDTSGNLISSFSGDGKASYALASMGATLIADAALDSADKLILTGAGNSTGSLSGMMARILNDGSADPFFNTTGYYNVENCSGKSLIHSLLLLTDTRLIGAAACAQSGTDDISISEYEFFEDGIAP